MLLLAAAPCVTSSLRLDWVRSERASECPSGDEVASRIANRLGCTPFDSDAVAWFEVLVSPGSDARASWQARVTRFDAGNAIVSENVLTSDDPDCAVLGEAVALTLAVVAEQLPRRPDAPSTTTATVAPIVTPEPRMRAPIIVTSTIPVQTEAVLPPRGALNAEAVLDVGTFPRAAFGARLGVEIRATDWLEVQVGGFVLPVQSVDRYYFGVAAAWAGVCAAFDPFPRWTIDGCARLYGGAITAFPRGEAKPIEPGSFGWAAASGGASVEASLVGPVRVRLGAEALVTLVDRVFLARTHDGDGTEISLEVLDEAPVALLASLGLVLRFR